MRISHKYKFIFICIPKTASESIRKALNPYSDIISSSKFPYYWHVKAQELKMHFEKIDWAWNGYFKFAFIRNPWERLVSRYHYSKPDKNLKYWHTDGWDESDLISFDEYIKTCNDKMGCCHDVNQLDYITDDKGGFLVDFVGRYENLEEDWKVICDRIGIKTGISCINASKHKHYSLYFTEETKQIVIEWFKRDIEKFNYKFEKVDS